MLNSSKNASCVKGTSRERVWGTLDVLGSCAAQAHQRPAHRDVAFPWVSAQVKDEPVEPAELGRVHSLHMAKLGVRRKGGEGEALQHCLVRVPSRCISNKTQTSRMVLAPLAATPPAS